MLSKLWRFWCQIGRSWILRIWIQTGVPGSHNKSTSLPQEMFSRFIRNIFLIKRKWVLEKQDWISGICIPVVIAKKQTSIGKESCFLLKCVQRMIFLLWYLYCMPTPIFPLCVSKCRHATKDNDNLKRIHAYIHVL